MTPRKITLLLFTASLITALPAVAAKVSAPAAAEQVLKASAGLHIPFVENKGQMDDPTVAYVADTFACRVAVTRNGQITYSRFQDEKNGVKP
jgi:hypothetical protein